MRQTRSFLLLVVLWGTAQGHPFNNSTDVQECSSNGDCVSEEVCVDLKCVDPCLGVCGLNTVCIVLNRIPVCSCKPSFEGHPFTGCTAGMTPECTLDAHCPSSKACVNQQCLDSCQGACGLNTDCRVVNHRPICACSKGFIFKHSTGCQPILLPECLLDDHCPEDRACHQQTCVDPCVDVCGNNTICIVKKHRPVCACRQGYSGNAFHECEPQCTDEMKKAKKFTIIEEQKSWHDALDDCLSRNMSFASVNNQQEWDDMKDVRATMNLTGDGIWLGAHDLNRYQNFVWVASGRRVSYDAWRIDEPSGDSLHCLIMSGGNDWISYACADIYYFACEYFS